MRCRTVASYASYALFSIVLAHPTFAWADSSAHPPRQTTRVAIDVADPAPLLPQVSAATASPATTAPPSAPSSSTKPVISKEDAVTNAINSPSRLTDIATTVHALLSSPKISLAATPWSDALGRDVALAYLNDLDPYKLFFTDADISQFLKKKKGIKKAITGQDITWTFDVFDVYLKRQKDRLEYANTLLAQSLPLDTTDVLKKDLPQWPSRPDQDARWVLSTTDDVISLMLDGKTQKEAVDLLGDSYAQSRLQSSQMTQIDILEVFLKSYAQHVDPHSTYLAPRSKGFFNAQLRRTFDGVGIVWGKDDQQRVIVRRLLPNSAASASIIKPGDVLLAVGQTPAEMITVGNVRLEDVIDRISGPTGTSVTLRVADASTGLLKDVPLTRTTIKLTDAIVSHSIVTSKTSSGAPFLTAVIKVPVFYQDASDRNRLGGSAARDVRRILSEFKQKNQHIDAIVLDLRGNGGGLMSEAVELVGTFVDSGVVVQVKTASGEQQIISLDPKDDQPPLWDGPLTVLIDHRSASASEITSAALQDYGRALIVGSDSYGKGTAQVLLDIDYWAKLSSSVYGQVNLTSMMFYRPSGASTQLKGVTPDVKIADTPMDTGERLYENALPQDHLANPFVAPPVRSSNPWQARRRLLQQHSAARWSSSFWYPQWKAVIDQPQQKETPVSLTVRRAQKTQQDLESTVLASAWKAEGEHLSDGAGADPVLREAILVTQDAFVY